MTMITEDYRGVKFHWAVWQPVDKAGWGWAVRRTHCRHRPLEEVVSDMASGTALTEEEAKQQAKYAFGLFVDSAKNRDANERIRNEAERHDEVHMPDVQPIK